MINNTVCRAAPGFGLALQNRAMSSSPLHFFIQLVEMRQFQFQPFPTGFSSFLNLKT